MPEYLQLYARVNNQMDQPERNLKVCAGLCLSWKTMKKYMICKRDELFPKRRGVAKSLHTHAHFFTKNSCTEASLEGKLLVGCCSWRVTKNEVWLVFRILRLMKRVSLHTGEQFLWQSWEGPRWHFWACLHLHYRRQAPAHQSSQVLHSELKVCLVVCNWLCLCFSVKCE
jgi:hypothetical protein